MKGFGTLLQGHVARKSAILKAVLWEFLLKKFETRSVLREDKAFGCGQYVSIDKSLKHARTIL